MKTVETRKHEMLMRVRDFGVAYGDRLPESTCARETFAVVASAVHQLNAHALTLSTGRGGGRATAIARNALTARLEVIARTARAMAYDSPDVIDRFHIPESQTDHLILTVGHVFLAEAPAFADRFVAYNMPPTFVADLGASVDAFERAIQARTTRKAARAAARAGIEAVLSSAMAAVHILDVLVANGLQRDAPTLAAWQRSKRVHYPRSLTAPRPSRQSRGGGPR